MTHPALQRLAILLVLSLPLISSAQQQSSSAPDTPLAPLVPAQLTGPPPAQIASARTIFLSSAGADPNFPIDSARAYNDIYAQLRAWGHYQLVTSAANADLILELHGVSPITSVYGDANSVQSYSTPAFQLNIIDAKASRAIWTITSPVVLSGSGKTLDRWINLSEGNVVSRLQVLSGQPLSQQQIANLTNAPRNHSHRTAIIVTSASVGLAVGGGFLIHHLYENSLTDGKAQQDAFCKANNIPLSMCAGG